MEHGEAGGREAGQELRGQGRASGGRGGAGKVLKGDMACEEMRKVSVEDGDAKLCEDGMRDNPGAREFTLEACVGAGKGRRRSNKGRLTMGNRTRPIRKSDLRHCRKEGELVVEVAQKPSNSSDVVQAGDGRKVEAVKVKRKAEEGRVEAEREA